MSNFSDHDIRRIAEMLKALSNPNRLKIFLRLASVCCVRVAAPGADGDDIRERVGELGKYLEVAPSTVSHHLKELRQAGLIRMERRGQCILSWVEPDTLERLARFFGERAPGGELLNVERTDS